jgi:hypothetical protein
MPVTSNYVVRTQPFGMSGTETLATRTTLMKTEPYYLILA